MDYENVTCKTGANRPSKDSAVRTPVPVTMKTRKGIDDDHMTFLDAGRIAVEEGVSAIALHQV